MESFPLHRPSREGSHHRRSAANHRTGEQRSSASATSEECSGFPRAEGTEMGLPTGPRLASARSGSGQRGTSLDRVEAAECSGTFCGGESSAASSSSMRKPPITRIRSQPSI